MMVSLTAERERNRRKEKRNLTQKKAFNDIFSIQINMVTIYLAFVSELYLLGVK